MMRKYRELKNIGGGFTFEVMNAVTGLYTSAKHSDDEGVKYYQNKCDQWEIEMWKQNDITFLASNDLTVGVPTFALNDIMLKEVV